MLFNIFNFKNFIFFGNVLFPKNMVFTVFFEKKNSKKILLTKYFDFDEIN